MEIEAFNMFFQVILQCLLQRQIAATIHRLECRKDALYKVTDREKALTVTDGSFLSVLNASTLATCAKQCTSHSHGRSFNFKKVGRRNCQILDIDKKNPRGRVQSAPGWIHYDPVNQVGKLMLENTRVSLFLFVLIYCPLL